MVRAVVGCHGCRLEGPRSPFVAPLGVEAVAQVRANIDETLFSMPFPSFFVGFMWTYFAVCMLALAVILIGLVGLTYLAAVGLAFGIGELKASWAGSNFIGKSMVVEPQSGAKVKMVSELKIGYWLALGAGPALIVLALLRGRFVGKPKA